MLRSQLPTQQELADNHFKAIKRASQKQFRRLRNISLIYSQVANSAVSLYL